MRTLRSLENLSLYGGPGSFYTKSASFIAKMGTLKGTENDRLGERRMTGRVMMTLFWGIGPCEQIVMSAECRNTLEKVAYTLFYTGCPGLECLSRVSLAADIDYS